MWSLAPVFSLLKILVPLRRSIHQLLGYGFVVSESKGGSSSEGHAVQTKTVYFYNILFEAKLIEESGEILIFWHNEDFQGNKNGTQKEPSRTQSNMIDLKLY